MGLLVFLLAVTVQAGPPPPAIPGVIRPIDDRPPLWVAASAALQPDGELQADLFHPVFLKSIEENRARNFEQCTRYMGRVIEGVVPTGTVEDRVPTSYTIVAGDVVAAEQGFYAGMPGTLFALRVSRRLKVLGHSSQAELLYFFAAGASIATPAGFICSAPGRGAIMPAVGDRMLVFSDVPAHDQNRQLMIVDPRSSFIIERGQTLLGMTALRKGRAASLDEILDAIGRR